MQKLTTSSSKLHCYHADEKVSFKTPDKHDTSEMKSSSGSAESSSASKNQNQLINRAAARITENGLIPRKRRKNRNILLLDQTSRFIVDLEHSGRGKREKKPMTNSRYLEGTNNTSIDNHCDTKAEAVTASNSIIRKSADNVVHRRGSRRPTNGKIFLNTLEKRNRLLNQRMMNSKCKASQSENVESKKYALTSDVTKCNGLIKSVKVCGRRKDSSQTSNRNFLRSSPKLCGVVASEKNAHAVNNVKLRKAVSQKEAFGVNIQKSAVRRNGAPSASRHSLKLNDIKNKLLDDRQTQRIQKAGRFVEELQMLNASGEVEKITVLDLDYSSANERIENRNTNNDEINRINGGDDYVQDIVSISDQESPCRSQKSNASIRISTSSRGLRRGKRGVRASRDSVRGQQTHGSMNRSATHENEDDYRYSSNLKTDLPALNQNTNHQTYGSLTRSATYDTENEYLYSSNLTIGVPMLNKGASRHSRGRRGSRGGMCGRHKYGSLSRQNHVFEYDVNDSHSSNVTTSRSTLDQEGANRRVTGVCGLRGRVRGQRKYDGLNRQKRTASYDKDDDYSCNSKVVQQNIKRRGAAHARGRLSRFARVKQQDRDFGPFIHVQGSKSHPTFCEIRNSRADDVSNISRSFLNHKGFPFESSCFTSTEKLASDVPWVCVLCKRGSAHRGLGDLFGPYFPSLQYLQSSLKSYFNISSSDSVTSGLKRGRANATHTSTSSFKSGKCKTMTSLSRASIDSLRTCHIQTKLTACSSHASTDLHRISCKRPSAYEVQASTSHRSPTSGRRSSKRTKETCSSSPDDDDAVFPSELWIHMECAIWTNGICVVRGRLHGLEESVAIARKTLCSHCGRCGATLGCYMKGCLQTYHYICACDADCSLYEDNFTIICRKHQATAQYDGVDDHSIGLLFCCCHMPPLQAKHQSFLNSHDDTRLLYS